MSKKISLCTGVVILVSIAVFIVAFVAIYKKNRDQNQNMENSAPATVNIPSSFKSEPNLPAGEKANWKTYKSDKYGFEIKYPDDWQVVESNNDSGASFRSAKTKKLNEDYQNSGKYPVPAYDVYINYYSSIKEKNSGATTLDDLASRDIAITKIGQTELGGVQAMEVMEGGMTSNYVVWAIKDSHFYEVFFVNESSQDSLTAEETQILSTFKFTDSISSVDTSDWKTYQGNASGLKYKIKHPQDWVAVEASRAMTGLRAPITKPQAGDFAADVYISLQDSTVEKIINSTGSQFSDRKAVSENITISNNVSATKLTVSSPSNPKWISQSLLIKVDSKTFNINDGAGNTSNFWSIASTFEFVK